MDIKMFFGKRLTEARLAKGYTRARLSELAGIHEQVLLKYEKGQSLPAVENFKKLTDALEVSADYFLYPAAKMDGIPKINDPTLYERYFILESLSPDERKAALTLLDSLIARKEMRELTGKFAS
jgi:transcriptional regulator with XRE-family HTH domain